MSRRHDARESITSRQVVSQLARFEGLRQLRSIFLWLAFVASGALVWVAFQSQPATLYWRSVAIAGSCLPLAVAALLLANGSVLRDHSTRVGEATEVPPTRRDLRMLGAIGGAWAPAALSLIVVLFGVVLSVTDSPAGSFNLAELAVGPLVVVLGQAVGVALGRWIPHPLAAPLFLVVLAGLFLVQDFWPGARTIPAASPFLPWRKAYTDWVQAEPRMPLVHLAYLIGLVGLLAAMVSRHWRAVFISGAVVVSAVVVLSRVEVAGEEVSAAIQRWDAAQPRVCEEHRDVRFCAIDGYQPWIDDWSAVVGRAQALIPVELGVREVRQAVYSLGVLNDTDPQVAYVGGRLPVASDLTPQVLAPEFGFPSTFGEAAEMNSDLPACMASLMPVLVSGEARAVAYLVLTDLVAPGSIETGGFGDTYQFGHPEMSVSEEDLALEILDRPESEITDILQQRWNEVIDPATASAVLANWFGLEPPKVIAASSYEGMDCECTSDGGVSCTSRAAP